MNYRKALEQAVQYIETHLEEEIRVELVAAAAGYSYYHLNRQFVSILGETVGGYIKKRRLSVAAKKLLYGDKRVITIAMEGGFESPEAFSRAFKAVYKISPQGYRKNNIDIFIGNKEKLDSCRMDHVLYSVNVHPQIVELPEIKVAGLRGETTLCDNKLRELWDRTIRLSPNIPNRKPHGRGFGICEACHENTLYTMNDHILFTEVAGVEVDSFQGLAEPFVGKVLGAGRYAVFTHSGSLGNLRRTFDYIWGTWFLSTREELDEREDFELYDDRFLGFDHPDSRMDIYIPIR